MKLKISLLAVILMASAAGAEAQTARNPLNHEPAQVMLQMRNSSWKLTEEIFYRADGTPFDKRSFMYDENRRKISEVTFRRSEIDKSWLNMNQCDYRYEGEKKIVINKSGSQNSSKVEMVFNPDHKPDFSLTYTWNNNADDWQASPYLRCEWVYDNNGLVTTCLKQYIKKGTNEWNDFSARILYLYDKAGALVEEIFQSWNPDTEQWVNGGRYVYTDDGERQKTATSYINVSGEWVFDGKTVYRYDEEGLLKRCEYYKNKGKSFDAYSINTYSESVCPPIVAESGEVSIYPNPVVASFELTVPDELTGESMRLYDLSGKQVKAMPVKNQKTQVSLSGLSSGVYILKIGDITKKIIMN